MTTSDVRAVLLKMRIVLILTGTSYSYAQTVPPDPDAGCSVPKTTVDGWFKSGSATLDGVVNPANSISFPNSPNCSFYEWSYHMFLWLTSPTPPIYGGGGGRIFESSAFFDVSPLDASGKRTLTQNRTGLATRFSTFAKQVGPNKLSIVLDKNGRMFEAEPPAKRIAPPRVLSVSGRRTEISHIRIDERGQKILLDNAGARIQPRLLPPEVRRPELRARPTPGARPTPEASPTPVGVLPRIQEFIVDGRRIFLNSAGDLIEVEQGQADNSVLIAQNGSLIYFGIAVNEVFAYFRTMQGASIPSALMFPTTQGELNTITTFASGKGKTFVDPEALAVEIKTSWIETTSIPNPGDYIRMTADIPTYDKTDPLKWIKNGHHTATVALVGMHVVGSTAGHPEMIWATFEHIGNTPNDAYNYRDSMGGTKSIPPPPPPQNTAGNWLFCAANSGGPFNVPHQFLSGDDIVAASPPTPIGPDNIIRRKAWGAASDVSPNFRDPPASNSEIISVNNTVRAVLDQHDVRRNYIMTGSTWLIAGFFPFNSFDTTQVGTSKLSNTSMETFTQGPDTKANGSMNCFSCHSAGKTTAVSHVFDVLNPLP
jgi:hypothetical protein